MTLARLAAASVAAVLLAACQSAAPIRFYTLLPPAAVTPPPAQDPAFRIAVGPVGIPAQVDTPKIVVREGNGRLIPVDGQRWIAPLANETRSALRAALTQRLGVPDSSDLGDAGSALPLYRVRVNLQRFESTLGRSARIDATWTIAGARDAARSATCDSRAEVAVGPGFEALAEGHQRALIRLADQIAAGLETLAAGKPALVCAAADPAP